GRMCLNSPDCSVDVVEATVMKRSCASAGAAIIPSAMAPANTVFGLNIFMRRLPLCTYSPKQVPTQEAGGLSRLRTVEKLRHGRLLEQAAGMEEKNLAAEAPRLADIVRRHHDLHAFGGNGREHLLDGARCAGIERRGRL